MHIEKWNNKVISKDLIYKKYLKNIFEIKFIDSICLKFNTKQTIKNSQNIFFCLGILEVLTNQKAKLCFAKKSIANFKVHKKMPLSSKITLRKEKKNVFFNLVLLFLFSKINFQIKQNKHNFNIAVKNLFIMPQLSIMHNFNLNDFGFNISFNSKINYIDLFLSGFQIKKDNEKTKN